MESREDATNIYNSAEKRKTTENKMLGDKPEQDQASGCVGRLSKDNQ
jgi:hypothetical protein